NSGEQRGSGQDDSDFNWDEYLEECGLSAVPHHAFKHVDLSLHTGLSPGMKLEVCVRGEPNGSYWVATIITTCGQLLLLRYEGYHDDRRADFWCDIMTADLHPIGWSKQHGRIMKPPEGTDKVSNWEALLEDGLLESCSAPANLLEGPHRGKNLLDLLCPGTSVELQDSEDPGVAWGAVIEENVGGRLRLLYAGAEGLPQTLAKHWVFYLHPFLHPPGWALESGCTLAPPAAIRVLRSEAEWGEVRQGISCQATEETVPEDLFKDKPTVSTHCFSEGMKLEAVNPAAPFCISPATVTKVFSDQYFLVEMDVLQGSAVCRGGSRPFVCHSDSSGIFPAQWSLKNGVPLSPPPGYQGQDFDWADYLKQCEAEAAPQHCFAPLRDHDFVASMKLEAVNPLSPEHIHVATVTRVRGQHIWLHLEGVKQSIPEVITHVNSMDIFPVSWCETNGYVLRHPSKPQGGWKQRRVAVVQPEKIICNLHSNPVPADPAGQSNGKYSCPKIYFNHRCFSGPYLNKGRIAELPQCVGPGSCVLVLKEVLTLLINAAYKPSRVLRELQLDEESRWQGHGETLKAKYKGKSYRATVEIVRTADQVAEFCRKTCIKLECCPNLFGPRMVLERCSENCSILTKTKYTHYYGKKKSKRIGRPPGGHTNLEGGMKRTGKRRKRRKHFFVHKKKRSSSLDNTPAGSPQGSGDEEDLDEEDSLSEDSGSELQDELLDDSEHSEKKSQPPSPTPNETVRTRRRRKARSSSYSDDENRPPSPKEIDGQALLLLTLPTVQECMGLKLGPSIKLCHHIERVKLAFYQQFAS
uniref:Scm like with four mbt domains 1 n=1 Tax=Paramormyrops kingsleyae TaxID=1676925 RepID=A0A3B3QXI8_9TELE